MSLIIKLSFVATLFAHVAFGVTYKNILFSVQRYTYRYMNISEITQSFCLERKSVYSNQLSKHNFIFSGFLRSHCPENSVWKRLQNCHETDLRQNDDEDDNNDVGDDDNDRGSLLPLAFLFLHLFIRIQRTRLNSSSNQCWSHFQHTTVHVHSTAQTQPMSEGGLSREQAIYVYIICV